MCCRLQQICRKYQNHLYVNFYCLAFSTTCSREQRNLKRMERAAKELFVERTRTANSYKTRYMHARRSMLAFQMYLPINNDGMVGQSREFDY